MAKKTKAKILLYDIETSPNLGYIWGKYEQDVIAFKQEWQILSVAYKWLGEKRVHFVSGRGGELAVLKALAALFAKADVVVAHNGDAFDMKKIRSRMLALNLPPTPPLASVDTLKVAKANFKFNSNKLDDLGATLKLGRKVKHTGFDLWLGCMAGDSQSWKLMEKYNKQDVVLLEKVYKRMLPWISNHPSLAALRDSKSGCPKCSSNKVVKWGLRPNPKGVSQRWLCQACGGYFITAKKKGE